MDRPVGRDEATGLEEAISSVEVGDTTPRRANDRDPSRDVPRVEFALPIAVVRSIGDETQVERGRATAAHGLALALDRDERVEVVVAARATVVREAGREERLVQRWRAADDARLL